MWGVKGSLYDKAKKDYPDFKFIKRFSLQWLLFTPRAQFWVFNARMPHWLKKNKATTYIQTWHGTPLKKLGLDIETVAMPGTDSVTYKKNFILETARWDYLIAPNEYSHKIFEQAFRFKNNFLDIGYPRNDILVQKKYDEEYKNSLKEKIIGKTNGRVILYAPTWRDDYFVSKGNYKFFMPFDLSRIVQILVDEDTLVIRPHYLVGDSIDISGYEKNVKICLDEDINDLYLISDMMVTDYSSVMFDYAILERPMLFYPYDIKHYQHELRGFYFDYSEVPGPIAVDEEEFYLYLEQICNNFPKAFQIKLNHFNLKFSEWESGIAAKKVCQILSEES
ncbi:glycerophosphotransferase [Enterococcus canintestini]|uniref:Glycerophosphotransferase n=1 Tax=Enterococcus canintestini TaxID=317010 RepID=A0A1L8RAM4_9ENTE|nr:glycerophosphotransferase [Enterococcus canintestini]